MALAHGAHSLGRGAAVGQGEKEKIKANETGGKNNDNPREAP